MSESDQNGLAEPKHWSTVRTAFATSARLNPDGKRKAARQAALLVRGAQQLIVDAGSTGLETALALEREALSLVLTNNVPAALVLSRRGFPVQLVGGRIDHDHECTLPSASDTATLLQNVQSAAALLTAAAVVLTESGLAIAARRPDQFGFKRMVLEKASQCILVIDHTKWSSRFDGESRLLLPRMQLTVVVDAAPPTLAGKMAELEAACQHQNYQLIVAGREGLRPS